MSAQAGNVTRPVKVHTGALDEIRTAQESRCRFAVRFGGYLAGAWQLRYQTPPLNQHARQVKWGRKRRRPCAHSSSGTCVADPHVIPIQTQAERLIIPLTRRSR